MSRNFEGFFVGQMKRKAVEVSERRLSPQEREEFRAAKQVEVKNFLSADAFKALPKEQGPGSWYEVGADVEDKRGWFKKGQGTCRAFRLPRPVLRTP